MDAMAKFSNEDYAFEYVKAKRWPNGVICPRCGTMEPSFVKSRKIWRCHGCKKQFSIRLGTIFEDSPIPLGKWLSGVWLMANAKNGVSSCEVARSLEITQKSAWHLVHRIRLAMEAEPPFRLLEGTVEADETFVGGKLDRRRHKAGRDKFGDWAHKTPVMGVLERGGEVRAMTIPRSSAPQLTRTVRRHVSPGSNLYTDAHAGYYWLKTDYLHETVNHLDEWARGAVHTNNIECFWSLFKRSIRGTWVRPSRKHMDRYAVDQAFRWNLRETDDPGRFAELSGRVFDRRLTWQDLVR